MYIIVAGAGEVGKIITEELVQRGHDVIVVDVDRDACNRISMETGANVICGNASDIGILKKAGIEKADVCIGLIGRDSANLSFTILANAFNVPNILVRMRNPSYKVAYNIAGAKRALNTAKIYMDSILLEIEHPSVKKVVDLGSGEASIFIVEIPEDSPLKDKRIAEIIMEEDFPDNCVFAGIYREDSFIIPKGNEEIKANDRVFLSGKSDSIMEAAEAFGI